MKDFIEKAMTFAEYTQLIDHLLAEGRTIGLIQSEEMNQFTRLNRQRMQRLDNTITLEPATRDLIAGLNVDWTWFVITEGWCGDAAQNLPVLEKIAATNPGIRTRYILRDEYPDLMDRFLTNGARSIPMLIAVASATFEVLGTWGSRPKAGQEYFLDLKSQGMEKPEINEKMQRWYNEDKGLSLQTEFIALTTKWSRKDLAIAVGAVK